MSRGLSSSSLTPRELDVLACLTLGKTNGEIAEELSISKSTVKSHLSSIFGKLHVSNRTQASLVGLRILRSYRAVAS
jgi:DNA-binding NarL/FixJ family response regulator